MLQVRINQLLKWLSRDFSTEGETPNGYGAVQAYLDRYDIGVDAIKVSVEDLEDDSLESPKDGESNCLTEASSDDNESSDYIYVKAYLEKRGLGSDSISISSIG